MASLHYMKLGKEIHQQIEQYGADQFWDTSVGAFQSYIDDTGFEVVAGMLDSFGQFYWEHRMPTWQGVPMGERDFYGQSFIPYNCRRVFKVMLGVPFESRWNDEAVLRMIEMVDTRLLEFLVNPTAWSQPKAVTLGLRTPSS